ncbi:MAG: DUF177 domain-containing protein [Anaerolineae bacterium]|jgi:uncharacterized protein
MRYNIGQLLRGPRGACREFDLNADIRDLDPELEPVRPLTGSITLMRTSQGILATGEMWTTLRTACRRCLEPCDMDVEFKLEEEFHPTMHIDGSPVDDVPEKDRDEALLIDEHQILDLSEVVRQALWLTGPEQALCDPECQGLCPRCGGNRNQGECQCKYPPVDPRLATLKTLLPNEPDSEERRD